jgi:hypothetical protein
MQRATQIIIVCKHHLPNWVPPGAHNPADPATAAQHKPGRGRPRLTAPSYTSTYAVDLLVNATDAQHHASAVRAHIALHLPLHPDSHWVAHKVSKHILAWVDVNDAQTVRLMYQRAVNAQPNS